jgi:hypothetical protein
MLFRGLENEFSTLRKNVVLLSSGLIFQSFNLQRNMAKEHSTEVFGGDEFKR